MNYFILTADPDFVELALAEVRRAHAHVVETLAPGVLLAEAKQTFETLAEAWRTNPPIFVRHICPVQHIVPLQGVTDADLTAMRAAVTEEIASLVERDFAFSVQTRILWNLPYKPFDVNNALAEAIQSATQAPLNVRAPEQILSVVCSTTGVAAPASPPAPSPLPLVAFLGLSLTLHNLSDWAGGVRRFAREEGQVSRSEFKLLEALAVFQIELPAHGVALDLGASPGGWTRVLRQHDQYVTAVDPGDLISWVTQDRGVRQKRMTAEQYLADEPDQFDIIVNDMRMDARDSARLMLRYAGQLQRHGLVIMTLKLPEQNREPVLDHAFNILREGYTIAGVRAVIPQSE